MKKIHLLLLTLCGLLLLFAAGCGEKTADACLLKADRKATAGDWNAALKLADRAVSLDPNYSSALLFRAVAREKNGQYDLALDSARQAVSLNPDDFYAQYTLGWLYSKDPTRYTDAFKALYKAHRLRPEDVNALILLANAADNLRSKLALNYLQALKERPDFKADSAYYNQLGVAYVNHADYAAAKTAFLTACAGNDPRMVLNTAIFLDRYTSSRSNAKKFYQHYLKLAGNDPAYELSRQRVEARLRQLN